MTIKFNNDGTVTGLWSDLLPLQCLGRVTVRRASNVEFNERTQEWEVYRISGIHWRERNKRMFASPSRQECLTWEDANWEALL